MEKLNEVGVGWGWWVILKPETYKNRHWGPPDDFEDPSWRALVPGMRLEGVDHLRVPGRAPNRSWGIWRSRTAKLQ